ncbi:hypothetical protein [Fructobacillus cardui]|nr:unnamed protein product [Fructobacillus cardui]
MKDKIMKRLGRPFEWLCVVALYAAVGGGASMAVAILITGAKFLMTAIAL